VCQSRTGHKRPSGVSRSSDEFPSRARPAPCHSSLSVCKAAPAAAAAAVSASNDITARSRVQSPDKKSIAENQQPLCEPATQGVDDLRPPPRPPNIPLGCGCGCLAAWLPGCLAAWLAAGLAACRPDWSVGSNCYSPSLARIICAQAVQTALALRDSRRQPPKPPHVPVPNVLDVVVRATGKELRDVCPCVS
jgi:hypothetical protein